jgi:hypothetical protein
MDFFTPLLTYFCSQKELLYYSDTKILDRTTKAENEEKLFSYFVLGTPFFQKFINELDFEKMP